MIEYVIFDCDGVLVDTEIVAAEMMVATLGEMGAELDMDTYIRNCSGRTFRVIFDHYAQQGQIDADQDFSVIIQDLESRIAKVARPIAGAKAAIDWVADQGISRAVVSNSRLSQVKHYLESVGISQHFGQHVFSAEMVAQPKPSPLVYQHAMSTLGANAEQCLVVEDSLSGVTAAAAAGAQVIGFTGAGHILPGHDEQLLSLGATTTVSQMQDLPQLLASLLKA